MPKTEIRIQSTFIGNLAFEIQHMYGRGGPDFPRLGVSIDLSLSPFKSFSEPQEPVYPVTALYLSGNFCSPPEREIAHLRHELALYAPELGSPRTAQVRLEFPLDILKVARVEQARAGDLRAAFQFSMLLAVHSVRGLAVQRFETASIPDIFFAIPKSQWVEQILPQLGYGKLELLEVRISEGLRAEGLSKSVEELRRAQKYLLEGDWGKAVAHCRIAIEAIPESRDLQLPAARSFGQKVDTFVNEHLKLTQGDKQAKLVADELKLLWEVSSQAVHPSSADVFKRPDAEFLVRNTTALVEYIGKLLSPP